jgi:hypothetical protein
VMMMKKIKGVKKPGYYEKQDYSDLATLSIDKGIEMPKKQWSAARAFVQRLTLGDSFPISKRKYQYVSTCAREAGKNLRLRPCMLKNGDMELRAFCIRDSGK